MPLTPSRYPALNFRKHVAQYASVQAMALQSNEVILAQTQITAAAMRSQYRQRFCVWLLQTWDRSENGHHHAHSGISERDAGVRRTSVTEIASKMQAEGLIRYRRGLIELLDQPGLAATLLRLFSRGSSREQTIMGTRLGNDGLAGKSRADCSVKFYFKPGAKMSETEQTNPAL